MYYQIKIKPQSKQSTRLGRYGAYTDKKKVAYVNEIKRQLKEQVNNKVSGAIKCELNFFFKPPKATSKKKLAEMIGKPCLKKIDCDNLMKPVADAMSGIVYDDDSSIYDVRILKIWGEYDEIIIDIY